MLMSVLSSTMMSLPVDDLKMEEEWPHAWCCSRQAVSGRKRHIPMRLGKRSEDA